MMTAERRDEGERIQLTSKQKFDRIREKMIVEVRLVSAAKIDEKWLPAKVVNKNRGGVFAKLTTSPLERFWHFHDVRLIDEAPSTTATLGEIVRAHSAPELPRREPLPAPPALVAALVLRPATAPPAPLVRLTRPEPTMTEPPKPAAPVVPEAARAALPLRVSKSKAAKETEIGAMLKAERIRRQLPQIDLSAMLVKVSKNPEGKFYNTRIGAIEFGKTLPTDDELVGFAEVLRLDLDALIAARDRDESKFKELAARAEIYRQHEERKRKDRERKREVREQRAPSEGRAFAPRTRIGASAAPSRGRFAELEDMVEALLEIVPMPADAEMRKAWFRCARELFRLSGGG